MGRRIHNALVAKEIKNSVILQKGALAKLLTQKAHLRTLHGGVQTILTTSRLKYWIIGADSLVWRTIYISAQLVLKLSRNPENNEWESYLLVRRVKL